jgi:anti-sigma factor RsiW
MSATHPETNLIPYLRGELSGRELARTAAHLDGCAVCRAQLDDLARTLKLVERQIEELPTPAWSAYRAELRRKLTERVERSPRRWLPSFAWGSFAAAGLVAAVALLTMRALHQRSPALQSSVAPLALAELDPDVIGHTSLGLLRDYPMVERLDMLANDNYDVIEHLDELAPPSPTNETQNL